MLVVSFVNLKSRALSRDPSGDRVMPRAEVRVWTQASYGNIIVLIKVKHILGLADQRAPASTFDSVRLCNEGKIFKGKV